MMATAPSEADVRATLNAIVDPCSAAAGAPAGLGDMGLVREVAVEEGPAGATVRVTLTLTEPGCLMGLPFQQSAHERLSALPGVADVDVRLVPMLEWSEAELSPDYAARLAQTRRAKLEGLARMTAGSRART